MTWIWFKKRMWVLEYKGRRVPKRQMPLILQWNNFRCYKTFFLSMGGHHIFKFRISYYFSIIRICCSHFHNLYLVFLMFSQNSHSLMTGIFNYTICSLRQYAWVLKQYLMMMLRFSNKMRHCIKFTHTIMEEIINCLIWKYSYFGYLQEYFKWRFWFFFFLRLLWKNQFMILIRWVMNFYLFWFIWLLFFTLLLSSCTQHTFLMLL